MRYLTLREILELHETLLARSGGTAGIRVGKCAALGYSLTLNHPFLDGNKRVAHAAMEVFLLLNGHELVGTIDEHERLMLELADGRMTRDDLKKWLEEHTTPASR